MLINGTMNRNRRNRRLWTTRYWTWIGESSTVTNLVISISFFAVASMVPKQNNQWNTIDNLISTFQGRVCIFWLRSDWFDDEPRRMSFAVKWPTILNDICKNRRDLLMEWLYGTDALFANWMRRQRYEFHKMEIGGTTVCLLFDQQDFTGIEQ
jgi:hypothetical protein